MNINITNLGNSLQIPKNLWVQELFGKIQAWVLFFSGLATDSYSVENISCMAEKRNQAFQTFKIRFTFNYIYNNLIFLNSNDLFFNKVNQNITKNLIAEKQVEMNGLQKLERCQNRPKDNLIHF